MSFGYMGLNSKYETIWSDGRGVTVYPDGTVIENASGEVIRRSDNITFKGSKSNDIIKSNFGGDKTMLYLFGVLALVAIVALGRK